MIIFQETVTTYAALPEEGTSSVTDPDDDEVLITTIRSCALNCLDICYEHTAMGAEAYTCTYCCEDDLCNGGDTVLRIRSYGQIMGGVILVVLWQMG